MDTLTVYHLSPSRFRASIQREGVRRSSLMAGRLVTHAFRAWPVNGDAVRVADIHDTISAYIDVWRLRVEREDVDVYLQRELLLYSDVGTDHCELARTGKLER